MLVNSITNCCKPRRRLSSFGSSPSENADQRKVRYKHLEEASDEILTMYSIAKAHREVQNSGKMRLYKALPAIGTAIIATGVAIAQPGKLSAKAASGLGFLALSAGLDAAVDFSKKKSQDKSSLHNLFAGFGILSASVIGAAALLKGLGNIKALEGAKTFFQKEGAQLAGEINSTKLANFSNSKIEPALAKHPKLASFGLFGALAGVVVGEGALRGKLSKDLSQDLRDKAEFNYAKAKLIQEKAREHFNSIDAEEI